MISNVNFTGTYKIDFLKNLNKEDAIFSTDDKFCRMRDFQSSYDFPVKWGDSTVATFIVDDDNDSKLESYLLSKGIKFERTGMAELFSNDSIKARMIVPEWFPKEDFKLVEINTKKFNELYKTKGFAYVGDKGHLEFPKRYEGFGEYLKTGKTIDAPQVHIHDKGSYPEISFQDGRHRYAYLRDMGLQKIPVVMDKESEKTAIKYGLI